MKKVLAAAFLLLGASTILYSQCDKPVKLTGSATEYLNADSTVQRTMNENSIVRFDNQTITVSSENDKTMEGVIHTRLCAWKVPYKEGKTVLQTTFTDGSDNKDVTITITGEGGKITLIWYMKSKDRMIRVVADKFEEDNK